MAFGSVFRSLSSTSHRGLTGSRPQYSHRLEWIQFSRGFMHAIVRAIGEGELREASAYDGHDQLNEGEQTPSIKLSGSTYANLIGRPEQKRIVTSLTPEVYQSENACWRNFAVRGSGRSLQNLDRCFQSESPVALEHAPG